jgi:hypothetical protein
MAVCKRPNCCKDLALVVMPPRLPRLSVPGSLPDTVAIPSSAGTPSPLPTQVQQLRATCRDAIEAYRKLGGPQRASALLLVVTIQDRIAKAHRRSLMARSTFSDPLAWVDRWQPHDDEQH